MILLKKIKEGVTHMAKSKWELIRDIAHKNFSLDELFDREEIEAVVELNGLITNKIHSKTWNALLTHNVLAEAENGLYKLMPYAPKEKKSGATDTTKLSIAKGHNQYYAEYIERAVTALINNEPIPEQVVGFTFEEWEKAIMNEDAMAIVQYLNASKAEYVGRKTSSASCDIIADEKEIELKYSKSNSTYYNTSVTYFDQFGLIPFKKYLMDYGVLDFLAQYFGPEVYQNISPVSAEEGKLWSKANPELYKQLKALEAPARQAYVTQVFNYLNADPDRVRQYVRQMLTKETSGKHVPDAMIIYHHDDDTLIEFTKEEILAMSDNSSEITRAQDYTFQFNGFHTTIAWQNGTGLNNPTIRVFFDRKE